MRYNMKTLKQQTLLVGEEKSTSSPEDSRASHFQQPVNEKVQPITVTSGRKCLEQFGKLSPDGSWARTFSELLVGTEEWYSSRCNLTWKLKGTKSKRLYFQLVPSMHRTEETERGLLLKTPSAMDARSENLGKKEQRFGNSGTLAQEVQTGFIYKRGLLPTPIASGDICHPERVEKLKASGAQTMGSRNCGENRPNGILDYMMFPGVLPTVKAQDCRHALRDRGKSNLGEVVSEINYQETGQTFQLNPLFVQEMMGFPYLWTELPFQSGEQNPSKPTETR